MTERYARLVACLRAALAIRREITEQSAALMREPHEFTNLWREQEAAFNAVAAILDEHETTEQWQPIETAPKDGTHVWAFWPATYTNDNAAQTETWFAPRIVREGECWQSAFEEAADDNSPTYWMPLPEAPK